MPSAYETQVQELVESGELSQEAADQLLDASPLRKEVQTATEKQQAAEARAAALEASVAKSNFEKAGVNVDPSAFNLGDLDVADADAVKAWAQEKGLVQAEPLVSPEELAAHEGMAASAVASNSAEKADIGAEIAAAQSPEEVMAIVHKYGPEHGLYAKSQ